MATTQLPRRHGNRIPRIAASFVLSTLLLLTTSAAMGGQIVGTIEFIQGGQGYTPDNAYVLVKIVGTASDQPACATDPRFSLNPATPVGKTLLAMLLAAKAAGTSVWLFGTGDCTLMGAQFESISYMRAL